MTTSRRKPNFAAAIGTKAAPPKPGLTAIRTRPVRTTIDLPPALHHDVKAWTRDTAAKLGVDLPLAEVMRELIQLMLTDEKLAKQLREKLQK